MKIPKVIYEKIIIDEMMERELRRVRGEEVPIPEENSLNVVFEVVGLKMPTKGAPHNEIINQDKKIVRYGNMIIKFISLTKI